MARKPFVRDMGKDLINRKGCEGQMTTDYYYFVQIKAYFVRFWRKSGHFAADRL